MKQKNKKFSDETIIDSLNRLVQNLRKKYGLKKISPNKLTRQLMQEDQKAARRKMPNRAR